MYKELVQLRKALFGPKYLVNFEQYTPHALYAQEFEPLVILVTVVLESEQFVFVK